MLFVLYVRRSAKILMLNKEGIIEKISYERRAYESVDEKEPILGYFPKNDEKIICAFKGYLIFHDPSASGVKRITGYSGRRKKIYLLYLCFTIVQTFPPDK